MHNVADFINKVQFVHKTGIAREHAYRPAIHDLLKALGDDLIPVNDPAKSEVGAPDFIILKGTIPIGHLEAKDIDLDIRKLNDTNRRQQDRYKAGLANLIYTNCLDWDFYRDGQLVASVSIGDYSSGIRPKPEEYESLENLLRNFVAQRPQSITTPKDLAERMAGKALLIKDVLFQTLRADSELRSDLAGQYKAFKEHLIHDITPEDFADIYAETIAYGMFAARLHDTSLDTFSRFEALELLPKSNPFLRDLFGFIAGTTLDDRIAWVIDDLAQIFQAANVKKLMAAFGRLTGQQDPFLHFYETFLAAYNPAKRKARGVWYTPEPVVNFIVRAVDEVLQTEFGLTDGLADTSKVTVDWDTGQTDKKGKVVTIKKEVHRVQILDPATGTGTFLAEVIKQIAPKVKDVAEGMWSAYIEKDLIPRLHGFELLMASYAMCHMKLDMILTELGYKPTGTPPRLSVYLTNSLEEGERDVRDLFMAQWLTREAREANTIKRQTPIMCVIGNPPYNVSSQNMGSWIRALITPYKSGLNEKKINLDEDYIKFIRFAESLVEKSGQGVVGMITSNSFLRGVTHRAMRAHLLKTFQSIYIFDLHGDANQKEKTPSGGKDENVFDIMQGVSISIFVKKPKSQTDAIVYHRDVFGLREEKSKFLWETDLSKGGESEFKPETPYYFFKPQNAAGKEIYEDGFSLVSLFLNYNTGIQTKRDAFCIQMNRGDLERVALDLRTLDTEVVRKKYELVSDNRDWSIDGARRDLEEAGLTIVPILYRPFDVRFTAYTGRSKGFLGYPRHQTMQHMLADDNLAMLFGRQNKSGTLDDIFVTDNISEMKSAERTIQSYHAPLYLYPSEQELDQSRRVNFDPKLHARLLELAEHPIHGLPDEVQCFDYIYGVLHCPAYRRTFAEFLKIDFPRIPWPATPDEFWDVSAKGTQLRKLHLMDLDTIGPTPYPFKGDGVAVVDKPRFEQGKIWINATQYFDNATDISWAFYIGGYQPAQKWLKDRKARVLTFDDVKHYQRILKILAETDRIMQTIAMTLA